MAISKIILNGVTQIDLTQDTVEAVKVYKKINNSWVEQSDLTQVFESGVNYIRE